MYEESKVSPASLSPKPKPRQDFTIPNLFDVKGKIGAYVHSLGKAHATLKRKHSVAVVTGGGSGIGTMIATAYVQNGAKVYVASRKEKQLKEVRARASTFMSGIMHRSPPPPTSLPDVRSRIIRCQNC
jgi:hypothetical protein